MLLQVLATGVASGLVYGLVSMGLSLIWGILDMVNFAHSDFMMIAMYITYWSFAKASIDPLISLPFVAALLFVMGTIVYYVAIRRVMGSEMVYQTLCTFGLVVFLQSLTQFLWTANYKMINNPIASGSVGAGGVLINTGQLVAGLASILTAGLIWWFIERTRTGWALQATAQNRSAAPLVGIRVDRMFMLAWGLGLGSVGVAGALLANFYYIFPQVGATFQLLALVAVALGGFGSIPGALLAGVLIGLVESLSSYLIEPAYKYVVIFMLYILVVLVRPRGLFGTHG
jgi:branched-chain amino acid transport system permease protein